MHWAEGERTREINKVWTAALSPPALGSGRKKATGTSGGRVAGNLPGPAGAAAAGSARASRALIGWHAGPALARRSSLPWISCAPRPRSPQPRGWEREIRNVLFPVFFLAGGRLEIVK